MLIKGKNKYLPKDLLEQLEKIKTQSKVKKDAEAFRKMASLTKIGLEVEKKLKEKKKKNIIDDILDGLF